MLRFELDTDVGDGSGAAAPELVAMGELAVKEKLTVLQLKELLMGHWATLTAASGSSKVPPTPPSASHFRIRDGKVSWNYVFPLQSLLVINRLLTMLG